MGARDYDMIVIGGGAAGLTAAGMSALLGAKTALIEEHRLGGECTWVGCIPSKTLLKAARVVHQMQTADRFGLNAVAPEIPFSRLMEHVRSVRQHVYQSADAPEQIQNLGVEVISATGRFLDQHTLDLSVSGEPKLLLTSRYFLIATGSRPKTPQFGTPCLTNESIFELTSQPKRLVVMGAGPVGIEMAQAFQRLGSAVTVVDPGDRILSKDDPEHAKALFECLSQEGISFRLGRKIKAAEKEQDGLWAALDNNETVVCDAVLSAIGREPNLTSLDLQKAGVAIGKEGIEVDGHCRTSKHHIFAAGDVVGKYQFTHMAEHTSKVAVTNAILRWPKSVDGKHIVWSTFTEPELAHLGQSEDSVKKAGTSHSVYRFPYHQLDRAVTENELTGEIKVIADNRGHILGVSILGANAGEMISEYALAMRKGLKLSDIAATVHPYPTYLLGNRRAAEKAAWKQLDSPLLGLLGKLLGYRGVRKGSSALS